MDRPMVVRLNRRIIMVNRFAQYVKDATKRTVTYRNLDRRTGIGRTKPSVEDMATARTVLSPICCMTSTVRFNSRSPFFPWIFTAL